MAQSPPSIPFDSDPNFLKLNYQMNLGEVLGVAVNSKGTIVVLNHPGSATSGPLYGNATTQTPWIDRLAAGLDEQGLPVAWSDRITGSSIMARRFPPGLKHGIDPDAVEGAADPPYALPNILVDYVRQEPGFATGWWRGVGSTHNIFVVESFIDELAAAAKQDPVEYRRVLLGKASPLEAGLDPAAVAPWAATGPMRGRTGSL